jgi:hypothetical protein
MVPRSREAQGIHETAAAPRQRLSDPRVAIRPDDADDGGVATDAGAAHGPPKHK